MLNYEAAVASAAGLLRVPIVLVGWSMGGLASMMATHRVALRSGNVMVNRHGWLEANMVSQCVTLKGVIGLLVHVTEELWKPVRTQIDIASHSSSAVGICGNKMRSR